MSSYNVRDWLDSDSYDANGNTITGQLPTGSGLQPSGVDMYDFEDRLILRQRPDGSSINVSYDADGIRRQKTILGLGGNLASTTTYLTDTNNLTGYAQVFEERTVTGSGAIVKVYTHGPDLITRSETTSFGSNVRYFGYDGGGSVRELTDETGVVTDRYDYDASGLLVFRFGANDNVYLYRGQQWDGDISLYALRARCMDGDSGRFWSMDGDEGRRGVPLSLHKYNFAHSNPITHLDPSGNIVVGLYYKLTYNVMLAVARIGPAFTLGGAAVGRAYNAPRGAGSKRYGDCPHEVSVITQPEQIMNARSRLDSAVRLGERAAVIESKYRIPTAGRLGSNAAPVGGCDGIRER